MNGCNVATPGFLGDSVGKTFEESGRSSTGGSISEGFLVVASLTKSTPIGGYDSRYSPCGSTWEGVSAGTSPLLRRGCLP